MAIPTTSGSRARNANSVRPSISKPTPNAKLSYYSLENDHVRRRNSRPGGTAPPEKPPVPPVPGKRRRLGAAAAEDPPRKKQNTNERKNIGGLRKHESWGHKTESNSKQDNSKVTKALESRINGHDKSFEAKPLSKNTSTCVDVTNNNMRDTIDKAKQVLRNLQEKRQQNCNISKEQEIQMQRKAFRSSLEKLEATVQFDDHLKDLKRLEQYGCSFIHDQFLLFE